jgi:hypothetical protein
MYAILDEVTSRRAKATSPLGSARSRRPIPEVAIGSYRFSIRSRGRMPAWCCVPATSKTLSTRARGEEMLEQVREVQSFSTPNPRRRSVRPKVSLTRSITAYSVKA